MNDAQAHRVDLSEGSLVAHDGALYRIERQLDFESVTATALESGRAAVLEIAQLEPPPLKGRTPLPKPRPSDAMSDRDWAIAEERYAAIEPLLAMPRFGRADVQRRAEEVARDPSTLYRWIQRYAAFEDLSTLVPGPRGWTPGRTRIPAHAEAVIEDVLKSYYLTKRRPSVRNTVREVARRCSAQGIKPPAHSTVRARINRIPEEERLRRRGFGDRARKLRPAPGHFPHADFPLAVVQIDHTMVDIILVDDTYRLPVGRPWITLAIDVFSRMVTGYSLSFDSPSTVSVGLCISHSVLPKEDWLVLHEVDADWPVWGFPATIHVDNAKEFRSNTIRHSCAKRAIHLEFRPVGQPHYGGHIERLLGTFMAEVHDLPGTTFSSPAQRKGYDSEKTSAMTLSEFERWLITLICKVYHQRTHSQLGASPMKQWEIGTFGNDNVRGIGLPSRPHDAWDIQRDFMPAIERTVQPDGVHIDSTTYFAECLRPWIRAKDPNDPRHTRTFTFRRDPRNIKIIWFFDPELKQYFDVPAADQALPSMSLWEAREIRQYLAAQGRNPDNTAEILNARTELREQAEQAQRKTKKARRKVQRRREHGRQASPARPSASTEPETEPPPPSDLSDEPVRSTWTIR